MGDPEHFYVDVGYEDPIERDDIEWEQRVAAEDDRAGQKEDMLEPVVRRTGYRPRP